MKKLCMSVTILLTGFYVQAQRVNHINIDPFLSALFGTVQVQYERAFSSRMTASLSVGYKTSSGLLTINGIDSDVITTDDINLKGIKIVPEFRYYLQNDDMTGFYTGAYYRYLNYTTALKGEYVTQSAETKKIDYDVNIVTNAIGIEIGYKLPFFKNRAFIDFVILGLGVSSNAIHSKHKGELSEYFYDNLNNAMSNYGIAEQLNLKLDFKENGEANIILPDFRYCIKFGFIF